MLKKSSDQLVYTYSSNGDSYTLDAIYGTQGAFYTVSNGITPIKASDGWLKISTSAFEHTCAIAFNYRAYCWGNNYYNQLGDNTTTNRLVPTAVAKGERPNLSVKSIYSGKTHSCVIAFDDKAYCWGRNFRNEIGNNSYGQQSQPRAVVKGQMPSLIVKSMALGEDHTCAIAADDQPYCWGGWYLGNNTTDYALVPTAVSQGEMPSLIVKSISSAGYNTCAIASNNQAYCWGTNFDGRLGDGTTTDRLVPTAVVQGAMPSLSVRSISAGNAITCAIASNNQAYCWGWNTSGQLGDNTTTNRLVPTAVVQGAMPSLSVRSISAGSAITCAIASNNQAYCWGSNSIGQLGDNTTTNRLVPTAVVQGAMPSLSVRSISAGSAYACAITPNSQAYCWGLNDSSQLGDNTTTNRLIPTAFVNPF